MGGECGEGGRRGTEEESEVEKEEPRRKQNKNLEKGRRHVYDLKEYKSIVHQHLSNVVSENCGCGHFSLKIYFFSSIHTH